MQGDNAHECGLKHLDVELFYALCSGAFEKRGPCALKLESNFRIYFRGTSLVSPRVLSIELVAEPALRETEPILPNVGIGDRPEHWVCL